MQFEQNIYCRFDETYKIHIPAVFNGQCRTAYVMVSNLQVATGSTWCGRVLNNYFGNRNHAYFCSVMITAVVIISSSSKVWTDNPIRCRLKQTRWALRPCCGSLDISQPYATSRPVTGITLYTLYVLSTVGVTIKQGSDWMIWFIAFIHSISNYKYYSATDDLRTLQLTVTHTRTSVLSLH
jgi:hypothetical protein